jgi:hypothetical protein
MSDRQARLKELLNVEVTADNYIDLAAETNNTDYPTISERLNNPFVYKSVWGVSQLMMQVGDVLDNLKKHVFYGKELDAEYADELTASQEEEAEEYRLVEFNRVTDDPTKIDMIHGIMGMATESVELLVQLCSILEKGEFDGVNIIEEIGDIDWYTTLPLRRLDKKVVDPMKANIAKLIGKRYKDGYSDSSAINRDTDAERSVLEDGFKTESGHHFVD